MNEKEQALMREGVNLFDGGQFFEAHDLLETLWKEQAEPDRKFTQGIIQTAVAFHHMSKNNRQGAIKLLERALEKLQPFASGYQPLDGDNCIDTGTFVTLIRDSLEKLKKDCIAQPFLIPTARQSSSCQRDPQPGE